MTPAEAADRHDGLKGTALRYLAAMEARDLAAAQAFVAPDAVFVFPGGVQRRDLAAIIAGSGTRYRRIAKSVDRCDLVPGVGNRAVVYVLGTLHGLWPDGAAFAGIRFIDRFEFREELITRQEVWNDSGEARLARI